MVRIRSCHVTGTFVARDNVRPPLSVRDALSAPRSDFRRVVLPPMSYAHEQDKVLNRMPAALAYIVGHGLNERFGPANAPLGIVVQGWHVQRHDPRVAAVGAGGSIGGRVSRFMC